MTLKRRDAFCILVAWKSTMNFRAFGRKLQKLKMSIRSIPAGWGDPSGPAWINEDTHYSVGDACFVSVDWRTIRKNPSRDNFFSVSRLSRSNHSLHSDHQRDRFALLQSYHRFQRQRYLSVYPYSLAVAESTPTLTLKKNWGPLTLSEGAHTLGHITKKKNQRDQKQISHVTDQQKSQTAEGFFHNEREKQAKTKIMFS